MNGKPDKPSGDCYCFYCGILLRHPSTKTWDHLTPVCKGGGWDKENLVISCKRCNNEKGPLNLEQFRQLYIARLNFKSLAKYRLLRFIHYKFAGERVGFGILQTIDTPTENVVQ